MKKFLGVIIGVFFLGLLFVQNTLACSMIYDPGPQFKAKFNKNILESPKKCINDDCSIYSEKYAQDPNIIVVRYKSSIPIHSFRYVQSENRDAVMAIIDIKKGILYLEYYYNLEPEKSTEVIDTLDKLIEGGIADLKPILMDEMKATETLEPGLPRHTLLTFTQDEKISNNAFPVQKDLLFLCSYFEYKQVGNWVERFPGFRPYCYKSGAMCGGSDLISVPNFTVYLFQNLNIITGIYLLGVLLILFISIVFTLWLIVRKEVILFIRPTIGKIILSIFAIILLAFWFLIMFGEIELFLFYSFITILLINIFSYFSKFRKKSEFKSIVTL